MAGHPFPLPPTGPRPEFLDVGIAYHMLRPEWGALSVSEAAADAYRLIPVSPADVVKGPVKEKLSSAAGFVVDLRVLGPDELPNDAPDLGVTVALRDTYLDRRGVAMGIGLNDTVEEVRDRDLQELGLVATEGGADLIGDRERTIAHNFIHGLTDVILSYASVAGVEYLRANRANSTYAAVRNIGALSTLAAAATTAAVSIFEGKVGPLGITAGVLMEAQGIAQILDTVRGHMQHVEVADTRAVARAAALSIAVSESFHEAFCWSHFERRLRDEPSAEPEA